jgi:hypothetical protein
MRSSWFVVFACSVLIPCLAQQAPKPSSAGYTGLGPTGFGTSHTGLTGTGFAAPFGPLRQGMGYGRGTSSGGRGSGSRRQLVAPIYVGVPVYGGGYYGQDYSDAPAYAPPQQTPGVVINQNFVPEHANPVVQEVPDSEEQSGPDVYQAPGPPPVEPGSAENSAPPESDDPIIYLIAFRDRTIVPALAYWVEGNTLKYVNMDRGINQATLDLLDRDLSKRLNQQRNVEFHLPAAR